MVQKLKNHRYAERKKIECTASFPRKDNAEYAKVVDALPQLFKPYQNLEMINRAAGGDKIARYVKF